MARKLSRFIFIIFSLSLILVGSVFSGVAQNATYTVNLPMVMQGQTEGPKLTICMGQEPSTLYTYGNDEQAKDSILSSVYDGPFDNMTFAYQPVILTKIPSLADGDAIITSLDVQTGDLVVDDSGYPVSLEAGTLVRPAGCRSSNCAITYDGTSPLQMDQISAAFELIPGLQWSDGITLTTADSVYSFNLAADPDTPVSKYVVERTASYAALDDLVITWIGLPGYLDSSYYLNFWMPLPEHVWGAYSSLELFDAHDPLL